MSVLDDIAPEPLTETIEVNGAKQLTVRQVSNRQMAKLFRRFPTLATLKKPEEGEEQELTEDQAADILDAMPAIIAAGVGEAGNPDTERKADMFSPDDKRKIVEVIMRLSLPEDRDTGPLASAS